MAVRLLATFPVYSLEGVENTDMLFSMWYPHVGLLGMTADGTSVVSLDGVSTPPLTQHAWVVNPFFGPSHNWGWWPARQRVVSMTGNGFEQVWEPRALHWEGTTPDDQLDDGIGVGFSGQPSSRYVKLPDRRIWFDTPGFMTSNKMMAQYLGTGQSPFIEKASLPFSGGHVNPGRHDEDIWVGGPSRGFFYNVKTKEIDSPHYFIDAVSGETLHKLLYVPEFGVLVSGHTSPTSPKRILRIWSLEVNPTQLSAPALYSGTVKEGQIVTYRTRLLGAHSDPAENEFVDWSIEGAGTLLDVQTKTDVDGYAIARVQYAVGETGSSTVTARVVC